MALQEVQLRNVTDANELRKYREQIGRRIEQYKQDCSADYKAITDYLD